MANDRAVGGSVVNGKFAPYGEPRCPGCSGTGPAVGNWCPAVRVCSDCGGLFSVGAVPLWAVEQLVAVKAPMQANCDKPQYFDFDIVGNARLHGWFDPASKRVVQWG